MGQMYEDSVTFCKLRKGKKLYNNFKDFNFLQVGFKNHTAFNKYENYGLKKTKILKEKIKKEGFRI